MSVQCMCHVGRGVFCYVGRLGVRLCTIFALEAVHVVGVMVIGLMCRVANTRGVGLACSPKLP